MLEKEELDIVSVCPRWIDRHEEMIAACIDAGCHVYSEKAMVPSLDAADRIVDAAENAGIKIAVAHQAAYLPQIQRLKELLDQGRIGRPAGIQAWGKQDHRGGGEDMIVLGTHLFNLMRFFLGDPAWMSARVSSEGHEITPDDVREATEPVGPVAGDSVEGFYSFADGTWATFESQAGRHADGAGYGFLLLGETGRIAVNGNAQEFAILDTPLWAPWKGDHAWVELDVGERLPLQAAGNRLAVLDLLEAVEEDRQPLSSARDARAALEMILGAYESQIRGSRHFFPASNRTHPLLRFSADTA
jgi:predicted dehydrogenase